MNKYDFLKIDCLEDVEPVDATSVWPLTDSRRENVSITSALLPDGYWVYGYKVYWAKGGESVKLPTAASGKFRTQREAYLHAIGFLLCYLEHFLPETQDAIHTAEKGLLHLGLFD